MQKSEKDFQDTNEDTKMKTQIGCAGIHTPVTIPWNEGKNAH